MIERHPVIAFRACLPADAALAVPLIISSGPDAFDYIFADTCLEQTTLFVSKAYQQGGMELGYGVHTALLFNGRLVAVAGLWSSKQVVPFTWAGITQIFRYYGPIAGLRVIIRGLRMETVVKPPGRGIAYLGHFGVSPELQGQGLGTLLIHHLIEQAKQQGFSTAALDVSSANPRAQKLYEQLGFRVRKANPADYRSALGKIVEHRYMEKSL